MTAAGQFAWCRGVLQARADGTFVSNPITLNDNQTWYIDRHYVAVNFFNGLNINTMVYQVAVK